MKLIKGLIVLCFLPVFTGAQETTILVRSDFAIRDFEIVKDSIIFIKKRDVNLLNLNDNSSHEYFMGGYGLEIFVDRDNNNIITAANELVENVSSVRFYNKSIKKVEEVFYYKKGKIIDFLMIPGLSTFVLSLSNNKIIFINFEEKPKFEKIIEIELDAISRRMTFWNNKLFYVTDSGKIYRFNLSNYNNELIHNSQGKKITDFAIDQKHIIYSTVDGNVIKLDIFTNEQQKIDIENDFVLNSFLYHDKLICGLWTGDIYVINLKSFELLKKLEIHDRGVLKIRKAEDNLFYSSGLDRTIRKWALN